MSLTQASSPGIKAILKAVYPIGSYYMNETDSTNPATLFGFGTWTAVTDVFIVGHGSTYTSTGGSATHTHPLSSNGWSDMAMAANVIYHNRVDTGPNWNATQKMTLTSTYANDTTNNTRGNALGGATDSGSTIPPYQAAYIWKRTA